VLRALVARGLDPDHLGAVAIGKRQPVATNATPEGRTRNRRVEFLLSRCLAANLSVVARTPRNRALLGPDDASAVEVLRLDPIGAYGMTPVSTVSLSPSDGGKHGPAGPIPPAAVAKPPTFSPYQPRTLSPNVQTNPLGPAVPY
jgi:hypothetical protein